LLKKVLPDFGIHFEKDLFCRQKNKMQLELGGYSLRREDALKVFEEWGLKEDKVKY
jgi:hypothetical protein